MLPSHTKTQTETLDKQDFIRIITGTWKHFTIETKTNESW